MPLVVGTDLSELSLDALRAAFAIAQRRGDRELFLVYVIDQESSHDATDAQRAKLSDSARKRLDADGARLAAGTGIVVKPEVLIGRADEALMAFAETEDADLVIVTSQGHGAGPEGRRLGGVSERLAVRATRPLLVVRDAAPLLAWAQGERPLRVLVGIDESAACQGAIQFVKALRRAGPIDVIVGHVYFPDETARRYGIRHVSMVEPVPELEELLVRDLRRRLGDVPGDGGVLIQPRLGLGRIGDHMLEVADAQQADVIVMGNRRRAGLKRLSSALAVVLHDARQSVVCVPLGSDSALDEVPSVRITVAATDRSPFGNLAVPWAYGLVGDRGEVHIVHVVDDHSDAGDADIVHELLELAPPSRMGVTTRAHVVHGDDAARTIAETAERIGADVICICSHGRSGLTRALVGSVADKLMRACHRPVLVLRPVE
jgi:nucleotide-binding universal stress UspA family protein